MTSRVHGQLPQIVTELEQEKTGFEQEEDRLRSAIKLLGSVEKTPVSNCYKTGSAEEIQRRTWFVNKPRIG